MKKILYLSKVHEGLEVVYVQYQDPNRAVVTEVKEIVDLPEIVSIRVVPAYHGATATDLFAHISRAAFVNLVRDMAREYKVNAVKMVRDVTGWGLKESKDFVESL